MTKTKKRKAPLEHAKEFSLGHKKKGNDGNMWEIAENKNGVKRWKKLNFSKKFKIKTNKIKSKTKKSKSKSFKIILNGSYNGVKKFKKMKKFEIIKSEIIIKKKKKLCQKNQVNLDYKNNKLMIYHIFDSIKNNYHGRWYNVNLMDGNNYKLDNNKFIFTYKHKEWEDWDNNNKITNADIKIYFTKDGWVEFIKGF